MLVSNIIIIGFSIMSQMSLSISICWKTCMCVEVPCLMCYFVWFWCGFRLCALLFCWFCSVFIFYIYIYLFIFIQIWLRCLLIGDLLPLQIPGKSRLVESHCLSFLFWSFEMFSLLRILAEIKCNGNMPIHFVKPANLEWDVHCGVVHAFLPK